MDNKTEALKLTKSMKPENSCVYLDLFQVSELTSITVYILEYLIKIAYFPDCTQIKNVSVGWSKRLVLEWMERNLYL